ncbi:MAG: AbrB/MazE/SpoVT family DNA-binding domain-containing protein [Candidatus Methanoperedens sp.]|nr:AbrB/MazE/SpoVT family DNA-binding domain-containing protein [Candidatus Methanoperedens sp.]
MNNDNMDARKVYVSGGSTYVISLPKKWVKKTNLKAGDSLMVTEHGSSLMIETSIIENESRTKEIKISQITSSDALERLLIAFYLVGYDTIKIKLDRKDHLSYRDIIRKIMDYLIGVEIVEDTNEEMTLEIMLDYKRMSTKQILQRMFSIDRSMILDFGKALKNMDIGLAKDIIAREKEIDRLYFLVVRQLKSAVEYQQIAEKLGIESQRDCLGYRIVVKVLERIADHIENMAKSYIQLSGIQKEANLNDFIDITYSIVTTFEKSVQALFTRNNELAETVFQELKNIEKSQSEISKGLFKIEDIQAAILVKAMLDSIGRIASYSGDIAEVAINMSTEVS